MRRQTRLLTEAHPTPIGRAALAVLASTIVTTAAVAQTPSLPGKQIPPSVLMELRVVENRFKQALASDCAPERCFVNGCAYQDHLTLDQPRATSLPGLPAEEGPGSVEAQQYLTRATCSFSHEKTVRARDVKKLAQRLEKRLSGGWLTVVVTPQALEPIPKSLSEPPPEPEDEEKEKDPEPPPEPEPEPELTQELLLRQLWNELLPHSPWVLAILLLLFATLILIWAGRRLGAPSLEDKMLEAQLAAGPKEPEPAAESEAVVDELPVPGSSEEADFVEEQERVWQERLERTADDEEDDIISRLLREWLKTGDYPTLARAMLIFGDRVSNAFEGVPELAIKKVDFANYFRDVDESQLPSRAKFYSHLNQQAMASLLLSQDDVQLYRSLREDFGASGFVSLMREIPPRYGSLLFALMGYDQQLEVAPLLSSESRYEIASHLLSSTRISLVDSAYLAQCVEAVRNGTALPEAPIQSARHEHGPPVDSAGALSVLLTYVGGAERAALFAEALKRHAGNAPAWYEDIAFNHMLTSLHDEARNDLLLAIDIRALAAWLQMQPPEWRQALVNELSVPLQNALAQSAVTSSRADQVRWARRGHDELVTALKSTYARGGAKFAELVA